MPYLPDFEGWAIFAKVAEHGSFTRAASELALSKATVSKALARLEGRLGVSLFHRNSRRLSLTQTGQAALVRARRILMEGEAIEDESRDLPREPRGLVRIAAPLSFGVQNLGDVLPGFLARYPHVSVDVHLSDRKVDLIAQGLDLALRIGTMDAVAPYSRPLHQFRLLLVASKAYLATHGAPTHPRELERHEAILFSQAASPDVWHFSHAVEGECSVRVKGRLRLDNGDVALPMLMAGGGLGLMPEFLVWQALRQGRLVELLPQWSGPPIMLRVLTPGPLRPVRVKALIDFLAQSFQQAPWARGECTGADEGG